jgi:hypothetical protein
MFDTFSLFSLKWKLQLKQGFRLLKRTQKNNNIISNPFLDIFITLTRYDSSYSHIPIHNNCETVNVMKIQNNPLQFFLVLSLFECSFGYPDCEYAPKMEDILNFE